MTDAEQYLNSFMSNPFRLILHPGILIWAVKRLTEVDRITSLFCSALVRQSHFAEMGLGPSGNYYEFGVGQGGILTCYLKALKRLPFSLLSS